MNHIVFQRKLHLPKFHKKSKVTKNTSEILITLNNISSWYRYSKTKIKEEYKDLLKEFYIPNPIQEYQTLTIEYRIIRHNKINIDKDNVIFALKWISDTLEELGYVRNDNVINFHSYDTVYDKDISETMLEVRIINIQNIW